MGRPKISLSATALFHLPLEEVFTLAARHGFDGVELVMSPEIWRGGTARVGRLARRHGVAITSVHISALGFCPGGTGPALMVDAAAAAVALDAPLVVAHYSQRAAVAPELDRKWRHGLDASLRLMEGSGTRLSLENHGTYLGSDAGVLVKWLEHFVELAADRDLLLTLDTCHLGTAGHLASAVLKLFLPRLANVHLSDFKKLEWARHLPLLGTVLNEHQMPGTGVLPLKSFLAELALAGYGGAVVCEVGPSALGAWSAKVLGRRLSRLSDYVRSSFGPQREARPGADDNGNMANDFGKIEAKCQE